MVVPAVARVPVPPRRRRRQTRRAAAGMGVLAPAARVWAGTRRARRWSTSGVGAIRARHRHTNVPAQTGQSVTRAHDRQGHRGEQPPASPSARRVSLDSQSRHTPLHAASRATRHPTPPLAPAPPPTSTCSPPPTSTTVARHDKDTDGAAPPGSPPPLPPHPTYLTHPAPAGTPPTARPNPTPPPPRRTAVPAAPTTPPPPRPVTSPPQPPQTPPAAKPRPLNPPVATPPKQGQQA